MINVTILCVGKLREPFWRDACAEYTKRLGGRARVVEVEGEHIPEDASPAYTRAALEREGTRLLARIPKGAATAALCVEGTAWTSEQLASALEDWAIGGAGHAAFRIGSAYGLAPVVKAAARVRLSLSAMTLPHQLARVVLLEQLYRADRILSGGKYHK